MLPGTDRAELAALVQRGAHLIPIGARCRPGLSPLIGVGYHTSGRDAALARSLCPFSAIPAASMGAAALVFVDDRTRPQPSSALDVFLPDGMGGIAAGQEFR